LESLSLEFLIGLLAVLICLSGFFSSSETGMLALNRYRLRHLVNQKHRGAMRASHLLQRPDRLIGVILVGNNLVNIFATVVASAITVKLFGESDWAVLAMPLVLTLIILIFAEVTPKSIAAVYPEPIAFNFSVILQPLHILFYPIVLLVSFISNGLARIFGLEVSKGSLTDHLHPEELRTVVNEAGELIPDHHQGMLLNVLDLEKASVEDIMVPRNDVKGIDIQDSVCDILKVIRSSKHTRLPVYEGDINNVVGILHLRKAARFLKGEDENISHDAITKHMSKPYFIPISTSLPTQLINFQKHKHRMALVVNEYGEVQGLATLVDLLGEIVGDFATDEVDDSEEELIKELEDGWHLVDASISVREINRHLNWTLPTDGPKTINGIIVEYLENIPHARVSFQIQNYRFEITEFSETKIEKTQIFELPPENQGVI